MYMYMYSGGGGPAGQEVILVKGRQTRRRAITCNHVQFNIRRKERDRQRDLYC